MTLEECMEYIQFDECIEVTAQLHPYAQSDFGRRGKKTPAKKAAGEEV
jgi:predicted membrane GTPase involved in stress response